MVNQKTMRTDAMKQVKMIRHYFTSTATLVDHLLNNLGMEDERENSNEAIKKFLQRLHFLL